MKIYLDESGTPGNKNLKIPFIFGGFYTFKKEEELNLNWDKFLRDNQISFNTKSKRYPNSIWLPFSEFLTNGYFPITIYSYLNGEDSDLIKQKLTEYEKLKPQRGNNTPIKSNPAELMWNLLIGWLVSLSIIGYIYKYETPITQIKINVDQTNSNPIFKEYTEIAIRNQLSFNKIMEDVISINSNAKTINTFKHCIQYNELKFNWKMRGIIEEFPGAICTLRRKCFKNIPEAKEAWLNLSKNYSNNDKALLGLSINATEHFSNLIKSIDWNVLLNKSKSK